MANVNWQNQSDRDQQVYGINVKDLVAEFERAIARQAIFTRKPTVDLVIAEVVASLLSDVQEVLHAGDKEHARQMLNCAKFFLLDEEARKLAAVGYARAIEKKAEQAVERVIKLKDLEWADNEWVAEASELGFQPGEFPKQIKVQADNGDIRIFTRMELDAAYATYKNGWAANIVVYND